MRSTVALVNTLTIHPSIPVPQHCAVCALWDITNSATYFGQWKDACGPDNYIGVCDGCRMSGFAYIGTIEEFKACQLRAMGVAEYEVYGKGYQHQCSSRADACGRIRKLIGNGISIEAVYQRSVNNGRLRKLNQDEQAHLVIEAMEA